MAVGGAVTIRVIGTGDGIVDRSAPSQGTVRAPKRRRRSRQVAQNPCMDRELPLLLVDVDGVISLFGFASDERPPGRWVIVDGSPHLLSAEAARHLQALSAVFEPVWCTGWEERANEHLPHALGLGPWPHVELDRAGGPGHTTAGHWKLAAIDAHAGPDRPLAWIDDAFNDACERWATERPGPTLLVSTTPATGLTAEHAQQLHTWATACA